MQIVQDALHSPTTHTDTYIRIYHNRRAVAFKVHRNNVRLITPLLLNKPSCTNAYRLRPQSPQVVITKRARHIQSRRWQYISSTKQRSSALRRWRSPSRRPSPYRITSTVILYNTITPDHDHTTTIAPCSLAALPIFTCSIAGSGSGTSCWCWLEFCWCSVCRER